MKAMILAAGRGERMRPLTDGTPKPLLALRGQPIISWTIRRLARAGFTELVINLAHLGHQIEAALGDGRDLGVSIRYSREAEALETAGGMANALSLLGDRPFLAVNGDIYCEFDFETLRTRSMGPELAHLVLVANPDHHPDGDFALENNQLRNEGDPRWTFSGIGVYRPELLAQVRPGEKARLAPLLRAAAARGLVTGETGLGAWHDIGTPERLDLLDRQLAARGA